MRPLINLENKTLSDTYWKVQLLCIKVHTHSSLEPPLEYNQDQMPLINQGLLQSLIILGLTEILCGFRSALEEITGKEIPESPRLESLEKLLANNFALSDTDNNTSGPLNRGGIANLLLLRKLLAICQKKPWSQVSWK